MWKEPNKGANSKDKGPPEVHSTAKDRLFFEYLKELVSTPEEEISIKIVEAKQKYPDLDWKEPLLQLDKPDLLIKSKSEAKNYLTLWHSTNSPELYPFKRMLKLWQNPKTQAYTLQYLLALPPDLTLLYKGDTTPLIDRTKESYEYNPELKEMAESNYNCEEVYALAAEMEVEEGALLLSVGILSIPELICTGLIRYHSKYEKIFNDLFCSCVYPSDKGRVALRKIFEKRPKITLTMMGRMYASSFTLEECLAACVDCKLLPYIIKELDPLDFSLDLILLAITAEIIDISAILGMQSNEEFINALLQHMILRYGKGCAKGVNIYPLTVDTIIATCMSLEVIAKILSKTTISLVGKLKSLLIPEIRGCLVKRTTLKQLANEFLHNIITGRTTNSDAIVYMTQISTNKNSYDVEIFEHILNEMELKYALIDRLPHHEVMSMALFYGRMVKYEILPQPRIKAVMALITVFLKEEPCTNKFKFGLKMLETFCDILEKYPFYCQEFSRMPQVYAANKSLYTYIRGHLAIQSISSKEEPEDGTVFFTELVSAVVGHIEVHPGWSKQFNMLTPSSLQTVIEGMQRESGSKSEEVLAKYLVAKRLLKETNHLRLYVEFVLGYSKTLFLVVRSVLFRILREFLERHKEIERTDRLSSLRTIGTYLGMFTFADKAPIRRSEFSVTEYLIESIGKECIYSAVVFVCKFIEECTASKIFGSTSPYVRSILRILSEIHFLTEGSDLISLEIEICFSKIDVHIEDILPDTAIQERRLGSKRKVTGLAKYIELDGIRNILAHISIMAIDFAIRDITYSIVDKVFHISTRAAMEIVKRDFPNQQDKAVSMFKNMSTSLAVQLACASAADPIFSGVVNNIMHFMKLAGMNDSISSDKVSSLVKKNLSICLGVVEHITRTRITQGLPAMVEELLEELTSLPTPSTPPTPPTPASPIDHYRISLYEKKEYTKPSYIIADEIQPVTVGEYHEICAYLCSINYKSRESGDSVGPFTGSSAQKKWEDTQRILHEIEKAGDENVRPALAIELLESIHVILSFVHSGAHDMVCLFFCQNIIGSIFMLTNTWSRNECIKAVYRICKTSYNSQQEVSSWLIYAEDERKFNAEVIAQMLDRGIMNEVEYDMHLGSTLLKNPQRIKFAAELLRRCILTDIPICTPFDFVCTIEALSKCSKSGTDERIKSLLKDIARRIFLTRKEEKDRDLFESWVDLLFCRVAGKEKEAQMAAALSQIEERAKSPEVFKNFLKASFSASVEYYLRLRKECSPIKYMKIEALGVLVHLLSKKNSLLVKSLEILTEIFINGLEIEYYQIQKLFTRLLQVVLEGLSSEHEETVFLFLKKVRPTVLGLFFGGYIELLFSEYIMRNMFLRNMARGLSILVWVYEALRQMPYSPELDTAVYACTVFVLQLKRFCPGFYLHYSYLFLTVVPIGPATVLLRSAWSLDHHPGVLEVLHQNRDRICNTEYYKLLCQIHEPKTQAELPLLTAQNEELLSHVLVDALTNQKEESLPHQEVIISMFSSAQTPISFKENILARLLEKSCALAPRPTYIKKTLDALLNNQACVESLNEIVRKDKNTLGKLIIHASNIFASEPAR
ncbi:CCR4-NOT transcription complex subunit 1 [Nematocida homosporus]|uniref:CCR4-NOT transcription complex subunit 1 n=1 Tax=Nematocida homosporus TaxID=1912981 RepID=UPI0022210AE4|nr:CCR4-NOT transcription complex subunit 1 [Nematocida homosporus]KAI5185628.1 CCR4-NOT transcription complex subunit 1 [Nematocida homosporus]